MSRWAGADRAGRRPGSGLWRIGPAAGLGLLEHPVCKAGAAVLMLLAAFGRSERLLRTGALFLVLSCAFGGALLLVAMVRGGDPGTGGLLGPSLGMRGILIAAALSYGMLSLLLRGQFAHTRTGGELQELTLSRQGRSVTVLALRDTGNTLQDPVTGRPVVVIEGKNSRPWCRNCPCWTGRACPTRWTCCGTWRGNWAVCACSFCPTGRWGGVRYAAGPAGGPGPLWPLGVPELFDRPLSHPAVRWGRILRPHRRTGGA
ncbi:MAG: sigma-E processing peptidase SpoIIGA [Evtepia gabavorous]